MKNFILILLLLAISSFNPTLLRCYSVPELICESDNIVIGKIINLTDTTYTLSILENLKGKTTNLVVLSKYRGNVRDWCRWDKYRLDQLELAFLEYDKKFHKYNLTAGSGEVPVNDSLIFLRNNFYVLNKNNERWPDNKVSFNGDTIPFDAFDRLEMLDAIKSFIVKAKQLTTKLRLEKDMIKFISGSYPYPDDIIFKDSVLIKFKNESRSHLRILNELMDEPHHIPWIK